MDSNLQSRVIEYASLHGIELDLEYPLGQGTDGAVWRTNRQSAVKAYFYSNNFRKECACYQRLSEHRLTKLLGFFIPEFIAADDELEIIEIGLVKPPFIIDFAKAYLDIPPDFSPEVMRDYELQCREIFEDRWPQVKKLVAALEQYGIYYLDAKPGNIMFADWPLGKE